GGGRRRTVQARPQIGDQRDGVGGQRAVEPVRVGALVAERGEQPHRARQGGPARQAGGERGTGHRRHPTVLVGAGRGPLGCHPMSTAFRRSPGPPPSAGDTLRSVLLLCWRDTGHPQGGGSEAYLQRIGAQLAASGVSVTLRTARYPGAPRREVIDGVRVSRAGGRYSVYVWAMLAMALARLGLGPLRQVRPDVVVDTQNG